MTPSVPPVPKVPPPPPVPTIDNARQAMQDSDAIAKRRGRQSFLYSGPQGDLTPPVTNTAQLLGQ